MKSERREVAVERVDLVVAWMRGGLVLCCLAPDVFPQLRFYLFLLEKNVSQEHVRPFIRSAVHMRTFDNNP